MAVDTGSGGGPFGTAVVVRSLDYWPMSAELTECCAERSNERAVDTEPNNAIAACVRVNETTEVTVGVIGV